MTSRLTPSDLEAAACEYDDRNPHQGVPARDAAYKGFIDGVRWSEDRAVWRPWDAQKPIRPGWYLVTKGVMSVTRTPMRVCSASWWDGTRFLAAANVLAWRHVPEPWEPEDKS